MRKQVKNTLVKIEAQADVKNPATSTEETTHQTRCRYNGE